MKTNYECTAYFKGKDGLGNCDTECQWWVDKGCVCAKDSVLWDGKKSASKTFIPPLTK